MNHTLEETIRIQFEPDKDNNLLDKIHTHFTEHAPTNYKGLNVIEVENHHTKKRYSVRGEEDLNIPINKKLCYVVEDGSKIFIEYDDTSNVMTLFIAVQAKDFTQLLDKSSAIREALTTLIRSQV